MIMPSRRLGVRSQSRNGIAVIAPASATSSDAPSASNVGMRQPVRPAILPPSVAKRRTLGAATRPRVWASSGACSAITALSSSSANRVAAPMLTCPAFAAMPASSARPVRSIRSAGRGSPRRHSSCSAVAPPTTRLSPAVCARKSRASASDFGRRTRRATSTAGDSAGGPRVSIVSSAAISAGQGRSTVRTHFGFVPTRRRAARTGRERGRGLWRSNE